ncbi:MAG: hypothetical protein QOC66_3576 [Pseudonocardiales bacterium]|nr:hypothetical protein [Pseudonocardiales bacterium]
MKFRRTFARAGAVAATAVLLATAAGPAAPATARTSSRADTVRMTVESVSPSTPTPSATPKSLTVNIRLENTTDAVLRKVRLVGERGEPIGTQVELDKSLAGAAAPPSSGIPIPPIRQETVDIPAQASVTVPFITRYSVADDGSGLCLCAQAAVYPLYFSAHVLGDGGVDQRLGVVATYLPSFYENPAPERVNWIWPLIDRPHRLFSDTVFTDDQLAGTVALGGRLDRALQVVQEVGPTIPLTLMIDPELIDELAVMAGAGGYTVQSDGQPVPGTGQAAAAAWLDRLRLVLATDPLVQVELTPYADPDIESLNRQGLSWTNTMPPEMKTRVSEALPGPSLGATVAWPASGAISANTLRILAARGTSTVVINASAVTPRTAEGAVQAGLARVETGGTDLAAALLSPAVEKYVNKAVVTDGAAALPQLVAELAVRAAQEPDAEHAVVITAPRYVDPSVPAAVQAIKDTSRSTFAKPVSLRTAVSGGLLPTARSRLAPVPASAAALPATTLAAASRVATALPDVTSMLTPTARKGVVTRPDPAAQTLLASLPVANQRAESSAWRQPDPANRIAGEAYARAMTDRIDSIENGVQIVRPSSGAYTLASNTSPLPITVDNKLPYPVTVRLTVTTDVNGLPGFSTTDIGLQTVDSNQKRTLNVPTKTERSGRIKVHALLLTPNRVPLGESVPLTIRSTALGAIGVIITIAAGVVLALALLIRFGRRLRKSRRSSPPSADAAAERLDEARS